MGEETGIAWTDSTWNPVRGCSKVSAGCKNCYAETFAERWRGVPGHAFEQGFDVRLVPEALNLPIRWRRSRRVFVNSMSDLFHPDVPFEYVDIVFGVMAACRFDRHGGPGHTFQILTKRPARMREYLATDRRRAWASSGAQRGGGECGDGMWDQIEFGPTVLPHVWLGTSVEDQRAADERIPELLTTPAALRFLSCEPLLGPVDLRPTFDAWARVVARRAIDHLPPGPLPGRIGWVIVGGESGPKARPCEAPWVRDVVRQCRHAGVPVFVKQLGANVIDRNDAGFDGDCPSAWPEIIGQEDRIEHLEEGWQGAPVCIHLADRKGGDPAEWPENLRVQQFPEVR